MVIHEGFQRMLRRGFQEGAAHGLVESAGEGSAVVAEMGQLRRGVQSSLVKYL